jgi:hypothetical protein
MVEPYGAGLVTKSPYVARRPVEGELVAVLDLALENRGLKPIIPRSRALTTRSIHEVAITDQERTDEKGLIDRVSYVGFVEISRGGVVVVDDLVKISNLDIGVLLGFDETHFPNHMTLIVRAGERKTGKQLGVGVGDRFLVLAREHLE